MTPSWALLLALLAAGCVQTSDHCALASSCPRAFGTARLLSGSVSWSVPAAAPKTVTPLVSNNAAGANGCTLSGLDSEVFQSEFVNGLGPTLQCDTGNGSIYVNFNHLVDPRALTTGVHVLDANQAGLTLELLQACDKGPCTPCRPSIGDVKVTVTVEEATGGAAPYPKLATPDLKRTYRIDVEVPKRAAGTCGDISFKTTLRLQQTAADWVYDTKAPCMCE